MDAPVVHFIEPGAIVAVPESKPRKQRVTKAALMDRAIALGLDPAHTVADLKAQIDAKEKADYAALTAQPSTVDAVPETGGECSWCGTNEHSTVLNTRIKEEHGITVYFCTNPRECDARREAQGGNL